MRQYTVPSRNPFEFITIQLNELLKHNWTYNFHNYVHYKFGHLLKKKLNNNMFNKFGHLLKKKTSNYKREQRGIYSKSTPWGTQKKCWGKCYWVSYANEAFAEINVSTNYF